MNWSNEAEAMFDKLLAEVPVAFRMMAKQPIRNAAEKEAEKRGASEVGVEDVIRGQIIATPAFQKGSLRETYKKLGIDITPYEDLLK
jgi:hypothetical protein